MPVVLRVKEPMHHTGESIPPPTSTSVEEISTVGSCQVRSAPL